MIPSYHPIPRSTLPCYKQRVSEGSEMLVGVRPHGVRLDLRHH